MAGHDADAGREQFDRGAPYEKNSDGTDREFELHSVVVSYEDRCDVCTIYPRGTDPIDRMGEWLSADSTAFVDLEKMR